MNYMHLTFSAVLENVGFARSAVASFLLPLNPTVDEIIEIKTMVSEGVSNAIIHGYKYDQEQYVCIEVIIEEDYITLIIEDYGEGIEDIEKVKRPFYTTKKDEEHAGMGLTIIENLCDEFDIVSEVDSGVKLIIKKMIKKHGHI